MKKLNLLTLFTVLFAGLFLYSCEDLGEMKPKGNSAIPEKFTVDIPSSLSNANAGARMAADTLQGDEIYRHLNLFIHVGEKSAELVEGIMKSIGRFNLNQSLTVNYTSEEDGRAKEIVVVEGSSYEGNDYEFQLTVTDVEEGEEVAMQVFWNASPVEGVAILRPYNINRRDHGGHTEAMYRVDYSEAGAKGYDAEMTVHIAGLQLVEADPYSMRAMKMFVGKKGDVVDVLGNSNHPMARFFNGNETGFNWAFVASGNDVENYAVAEVGLPSSDLNSTSRVELLETYSVKNVLAAQIEKVWPNIPQELLNAYLQNTAAPGYFADGHFVQGGESPAEKYNELEENIEILAPYNPSVVSNLTISFKEQ